MKVSPFLFLPFFISTVFGELPSLTEPIGKFAVFDFKDAKLQVATDGDIELVPMRGRDDTDNDRFPIEITVQTRRKDNGSGRWTNRKLDRSSLQAIGEAAIDPEKPIGFTAKVTSDIEYQVEISSTRKGPVVRAWLVNLGEKVDDFEIRLVLHTKLPNIYYYLNSKDEDKIKRGTKGSRLRLTRLDGKRLKLDFEDKLVPAEEELEEGFAELELRSDKTGRMDRFKVISPDPKKAPLKFYDFIAGPVVKGFGFGQFSSLNTVGQESALEMHFEVR